MSYTEKEALQYLVGLGETKLLEVKGHMYSTKELHKVPQPKAAAITVTTLTALVDYIKSGLDSKSSENLLIHVKSPKEVDLCSELRAGRDREYYLSCEAQLPNLSFSKFMDVENFNIMLQSMYVQNTDRELLLKITGTIQDENVQTVGDDGVSQAVTIKSGIAKRDDVLVPNPVTLAPYRTFPEISQPESIFIFRMQTGPQAALFEADGGAWRNESMLRIKKYLEKELTEFPNVKVIS